MSGPAADRVAATVRVAIRRFNEDRDSRPGRDGDRPAEHGQFAVNEISALDGHVLAVGELRGGPGRTAPLVVAWEIGEKGEVAGIEAFISMADAVTAIQPGA